MTNNHTSHLLIHPKFEEYRQGIFSFNAKTHACASEKLLAPIFKEFWNGFCCHKGDITFTACNKPIFQLGNITLPHPPKNGYRLTVSETGVGISASDEKTLIYGFFAFLERIRPVNLENGNERFEINCTYVEDYAIVQNRMVHLCIFPETTLFFVQKFIRLASFLRYTHVIVEFWGTLQYDCLKELGWENAYSKDELRPIFNEARELGLEIVPMFNHWGHASASRVAYGKHVVLDQNLKYSTYFDASGWNWNLTNPDVKELHKKMRDELIELCGDGEYFHIGCDEAYGTLTDKDYYIAIDYINDVTAELQEKQRKTFMWGDMLLCHKTLDKQTENCYACLCKNTDLQERLFKRLSRDVIIADWQYNATKYPIETALFFQEKGFEVFCCPWHNDWNAFAAAKTVKAHNLSGIMHSTWHTLASEHGTPNVAKTAKFAWEENPQMPDYGYYVACLASVLRKISFQNGNYEKTGWSKIQIQEYL